MTITIQQANALIERFSTAMLNNDSNCKSAICKIENRYIRISVMYRYKAVVFTDTLTNEKVVKSYE